MNKEITIVAIECEKDDCTECMAIENEHLCQAMTWVAKTTSIPDCGPGYIYKIKEDK